MIAAFQMYDWTEVQGRTDRFWHRLGAALRAEGIEAPSALSRPDDLHAAWPRPDLLLGQTCGLPYVSGRCGGAVLVARPDYGLEHAHGGTYQSALICHAEDPAEDLAAFRGRVAAVNEMGSQSGCNALGDAVQKAKLDDGRGFFGSVTLSGSHRQSARLVAGRKADIAAIDAVAWALFEELEPVRHARLRVLGWTRVMPALPFITSARNAHLTSTLLGALIESSTCERQINGIPCAYFPTEDDHYDPVRKMAQRLRGFRLAPDTPPL